MSGPGASTGREFDPSIALTELLPGDAVHLAGLLTADLRRHEAAFLRAVAFKDVRSAVRASHSVASIAAAVGGAAVSRLAGEIEQVVRAQDWEGAATLERPLCLSLNTLVDEIERWQAGLLDRTRAGAPSADGTHSGGEGQT